MLWETYNEYLNSAEWKEKAREAKIRSGWRCQVCNQQGDNTQLHAHHRTYDRIGNELAQDITVLCQDCHKLFHGKSEPDWVAVAASWFVELTARLRIAGIWNGKRSSKLSASMRYDLYERAKEIVAGCSDTNEDYELGVGYVAELLGV